MSTSRHIDKICCIVLAATLLLTVLFMNAGKFGVQAVSAAAGYTSRLFNPSTVHNIDIVMDDWDSFIEGCADEKYEDCTVVIDGEAFRNAAIRAKGNTSLSMVESYGNNRYSFKIEFDHYDNALSYYGLDKLCLNNIIQDNTYMKDYLTYQMMRQFGVDAPLCSYSYITVNGEDWGLYLAVEGVEDAFLQRSYGTDHGELYKPDSMDMGGGRGNGQGFKMEDFEMPESANDMPESKDNDISGKPPMPESAGNDMQRELGMPDFPGNDMHRDVGIPDFSENEANSKPNIPNILNNGIDDKPDIPDFTDNDTVRKTKRPEFPAQMGGGAFPGRAMGSSDVSLIYSDDAFDSYTNIFENAKTDITDADKTRLIESLKKLNSNEDLEDTVNVEEVIRYFVVHNFVLNFDSYTGGMIHNYYLYEQDGQLSMIPWDYNLAFGGFESQSDATALVNYPIDTPVSGGTIDSRPMLAWIFNSEEYTELYHQYFNEFIEQYFDSGRFASLIDSTKEMIAPYVESDPTKFCTYEAFEKGVSTLADFCLLRAESIRGQLGGTIPATADGQAQDSSTLINADELAISDMGTMELGHGSRRRPSN